MDKKELLKACSFYKGQDSFPAELRSFSPFAFLFWEAEQNYVDDVGSDRMKEAVDFYKSAGLDTLPASVLPVELAAELFAAACHASPDSSPADRIIFFRNRFLPAYLGLTKI